MDKRPFFVHQITHFMFCRGEMMRVSVLILYSLYPERIFPACSIYILHAGNVCFPIGVRISEGFV